jgi:hypothetical protein
MYLQEQEGLSVARANLNQLHNPRYPSDRNIVTPDLHVFAQATLTSPAHKATFPMVVNRTDPPSSLIKNTTLLRLLAFCLPIQQHKYSRHSICPDILFFENFRRPVIPMRHTKPHILYPAGQASAVPILKPLRASMK